MYLVPQLVVSLNNTGAIAVIQLTEKDPILISKAILQGPYTPNDPSMIIEKRYLREVGSDSLRGGDLLWIVAALVVIAVAIPLIALLTIWLRHK